MALQSFIQKVAEMKNEKNITIKKNFSLSLTSGVEIILECTIFEFLIFCLQELSYIWYDQGYKALAPERRRNLWIETREK